MSATTSRPTPTTTAPPAARGARVPLVPALAALRAEAAADQVQRWARAYRERWGHLPSLAALDRMTAELTDRAAA